MSDDALRGLQALLAQKLLTDRKDLRDAQRRAEYGRGGADATITAQPARPPVVPVSLPVAIATFPHEIREQTVRLLARLLRGHQAGVAADSIWVGLSRAWTDWRSSLVIVQPATVLAWHRRVQL